jgi:hypothetical protein
MASSKIIYGVDRSAFPGPDAMAWLQKKNPKIRFACFYLAPAPGHADPSWMGQRSDLAQKGWGFLPTYVGLQAHVKQNGANIPNPNLSAARGTADGTDACHLITNAGFAVGSVVYLDLEEGDVPSGAYQAYILAWMAAVKAHSFVPAIYCPGGAAPWARRYARIVWLAAPENLDGQGHAISAVLDPQHLPASSAAGGPIAAQFLWEIEFSGLTQPADGGHGPRFDLNTGLAVDPSDYACVDDALNDLAAPGAAPMVDWSAVAASNALDEFKAFSRLDVGPAPAGAPAAAPSSPTSDPHCGPATAAADRLMPRDKVALDLAEARLAEAFLVTAVDPGLTEADFAEASATTVAAAPGAIKFAAVHWPKKDMDAPDYHHLASSRVLPLPADGVAVAAEFDLTVADIELVLAANRMDPVGFDDTVALAIRGARLGRLADPRPPLDIEDVAATPLTETRPDHRDFKCLIGFYRRVGNAAARSFSLFTASTVLNPKYVEDWFLYANGRQPSGDGNVLPTGCYVYRVGAHNSPHAGPVKPALRLTDSSNLHLDGSVTVIRTKNDECYGVDDVWCKTIPADNVHCSFQTVSVAGWGAPFSSAGCMTIRGQMTPTDQWAKAQAIMNRLGQDKRCDLALVTGRDLAIAAQLRVKGLAGDPASVQSELGRLRPGSQGDEVTRLQKKLGLDETGYFGGVLKKTLVDEQAKRGLPIDGIYSPALDQSFGWNVFA